MKRNVKVRSSKKVSTKEILPLEAKLRVLSQQIHFSSGKFVDGDARLYILGNGDLHQVATWVEKEAPDYQKKALLKKAKEVLFFQTQSGPLWIYSPQLKMGPTSHQGRLEESFYSQVREQVGGVLSAIKATGAESLHIEFHSSNDELETAFFTSLNLFGYNYKNSIDEKQKLEFPKIYLRKFNGKVAPETLLSAEAASSAINLARHLVNTPPNFLNPSSMKEFVLKTFKSFKNSKVDVWDSNRLKKERMGLHLAVGQGAQHEPCLIHIRYRPKSKNPLKPIAFVGKGITFDSGGYDIKPSSGMRLMKKDMGGAACVLALAQWANEFHYHRPLDFYLAMAENMVDAKSFRPSDVVTARNGMKVEIHNTDAEGRLVLADALDVAVTQTGADEASMVIDVATLTGAIKVALGSEIAGLFANDDELAENLNKAGQMAGDLNWRMPLFSKYTGPMSTPFADVVNALDGFGGAITAALFLEKFVRQKPWAHLDIYAWNDKASGPFTFAGGSGQGVQCLIQFLKTIP